MITTDLLYDLAQIYQHRAAESLDADDLAHAKRYRLAGDRIAELEKQRDELLAALEQFATWGRMQHKAQSKGCHATFDMMALRDEIELAEATIASVKEK